MGIGNLISSHSLSAGHVPLGTGRDKVGIRALMSIANLWVIVLCLFLYYCGIRLSNIGFVIIASSILRCVCFIIVF